jgi:predicted transcriptional regulator
LKLITKLFVITSGLRLIPTIRRVEMTSRRNPTEAELDLLKILWENGPCTVNQVHALLKDCPPRGYTTILKLLQIMAEKGLVNRDEKGRAHVYRAIASDTQIHCNLVKRLLAKAFDNSASKLVAQALAVRPVSPEELAEIRCLLDKIDEESK